MGQEWQIVPQIRQITPNNEKRKKFSDMVKQGVYTGSINTGVCLAKEWSLFSAHTTH